MNIHWFRVEKSKGLTFNYRFTLNHMEPWKTVDLKPKKRGRPTGIGNTKLSLHRSVKGIIKKEKLDDLPHLLPYVPPIHHEFYRSLTGATSQTTEEDESSSEEEQED